MPSVFNILSQQSLKSVYQMGFRGRNFDLFLRTYSYSVCLYGMKTFQEMSLIWRIRVEILWGTTFLSPCKHYYMLVRLEIFCIFLRLKYTSCLRVHPSHFSYIFYHSNTIFLYLSWYFPLLTQNAKVACTEPNQHFKLHFQRNLTLG